QLRTSGEVGGLGDGAVKNRTGYLLQNQWKATIHHAKETAEGQAKDEAPFIGSDVGVEPFIRLPRNPNCLSKRDLLLGFILHTADAAGADTIKRIALITAAVEICFISLFASRGWKWCRGSGDSPNKIAAGLFRGRQ